MAASLGGSHTGTRAVAYFQERAEDAADAFRDLISRSTGGAIGAASGGVGGGGIKGGSASYLDTGEEKVGLIHAQVDSSDKEVQLEGLRRIVAVSNAFPTWLNQRLLTSLLLFGVTDDIKRQGRLSIPARSSEAHELSIATSAQASLHHHPTLRTALFRFRRPHAPLRQLFPARCAR